MKCRSLVSLLCTECDKPALRGHVPLISDRHDHAGADPGFCKLLRGVTIPEFQHSLFQYYRHFATNEFPYFI